MLRIPAERDILLTPLDEIKGLLPKLAEGALAQQHVAAVLPVELLYPHGGFVLHVMCALHPPESSAAGTDALSKLSRAIRLNISGF